MRVPRRSTAHHEAAAHVLAGEQAVELSGPECICSDVIRVEVIGRPRPPLTARLPPHEGTQAKGQLGGLLSLQRVTTLSHLFLPFPRRLLSYCPPPFFFFESLKSVVTNC